MDRELLHVALTREADSELRHAIDDVDALLRRILVRMAALGYREGDMVHVLNAMCHLSAIAKTHENEHDIHQVVPGVM